MSTYALFFLVGFVTDFTTIPEFYLLREIGLNVADCYAAATTINVPWSLRPIWGYMSDWAGNRHRQLSFMFLMAFVLWMIVRGVNEPVGFVVFLLLVCEIAPSAGLTIADAYVVRMTKRDRSAMPKHHRFRILGRILAGRAFAAFASWHEFMDRDAVNTFFLVQALVFMVAAPLALAFLREDDDAPTKTEEDVPAEAEAPKNTVERVREVARIGWNNRPVRVLLICSVAFAALPDAGTSVQYFLVGPLRISPHTLATIDTVRGIFDFLGTFVRTDVDLERAISAMLSVSNLMCVPILAVVCRSVVDWVDDATILIASSAVGAFASSAFSTVCTVKIAEISPHGREGGVYNSLISVESVGKVVGVFLTYILTKWYEIDHDNFSALPDFVVLTSLLGCVAALVIAAFV